MKLSAIGRPGRAAGEAATGQGITLQPYRGYGSPEQVFLIGRVFRQPWPGAAHERASLVQSIAGLGRRLLRRGIAAAPVQASFGGTEQQVRTDRDGYFRVHLRPSHPVPVDRVWHTMTLALLAPEPIRAEAELFIPPPSARYVVISDIDDTVMHTGVGNKASMLWRLFLQRAENRVAFPGVAALLQAFHHGAGGGDRNPMLYVSRAPWSIYEVLESFFRQHDIPVGPVLFLREWGLTLQRPLPRRGKGHKLELIRNMLDLYRDLPFILIGDSGQRDPEIYARIVREHPGRVLAIYIRNVSRDAGRHQAIGRLAAEVAGAGSSLVLAGDSSAMAKHAARHGLITPAATATVREKSQAQGQPASTQGDTRKVSRATPSETRAAIEHGALEQVLDHASGDDQPANIVVEPGGSPRP